MASVSRRTVTRNALVALIIVMALGIALFGIQMYNRPQEIALQTTRYELLYEPSILPITPQPNGKLCWDIAPASWQELKSSGSPFSDQGGLAAGMAADDIAPNAQATGLSTYAVVAQTPLTANYHLWLPSSSSNPNPVNLLMLAILDEKQLISALEPSPLCQDRVGHSCL
jgi:hypothetical protein